MAGLYFEEFSVGQKIVTVGRTITESDIVTFAGMSGDFNLIHTDIEYSKQTARTGILEGTVLAFREINEWKFVKPIFIGDTMHAELNVTETKSLPRIGGGSVTIAIEIKNQNNEVCQRGSWTVLMMSKPK